MDTNVECMSFGEFEALGYFQLLDMRYDDRNAVTERDGETAMQFYLI